MQKTTVVLAILAVMAIAAPAVGDWNYGDPYKYKQDLDTRVDLNNRPYATGVNATDNVVADDFPCTETGAITSVHIPGSWGLADEEPDNFRGFLVGFHSDVPASDTAPSRPGAILWSQLIPKDFIQSRFGTATIGWWYDQTQDPHWRPVNLSCWQYNIDLAAHAESLGHPLFVQQGTQQDPLTYWLSIRALIVGPGTPDTFGWVTSSDSWQDDASWVDWDSFTGGPNDPWTDMVYGSAPPPHPLFNQSINMAFVLVPEPSTLLLLGMGAVSLLAYAWRRRRGAG